MLNEFVWRQRMILTLSIVLAEIGSATVVAIERSLEGEFLRGFKMKGRQLVENVLKI